MNIIDIQARIDEAEKQVADFVAAEQMEDAYKAEGKLAQLREDMASAVKAMEAENAALKAQQIAEPEAERGMFAQAFGDEADFQGLQPGMRGTAVMDAAWATDNPVSTDTDLPAWRKAPSNFLDTLPKGTANGDEKYFVTPALDNAAAIWNIGDGDKPESELEWTEATAHMDTIAHWIPIHKTMARRYDTLDERTRGALMDGLEFKADAIALRASEQDGIVGVVNTAGIIEHTLDTTIGINLRDNLVTMARKARVASGYAPNYVCLSPYAIERLSFMKDSTGNYLFPDLRAGGTIAGMTVVEDVNMTAGGKETALVYYNRAAEWKTAGGIELTVGTVNKQFIQNAYTLLAETDALLRVDIPAAFAYCADIGLAPESSY